ncbi:MAG: hypothetical protein EXQ98_05790 [Alphaproteobacteria bacterium]|nr:hypothetical protein [Alphaproteobacteria bacterium]
MTSIDRNLFRMRGSVPGIAWPPLHEGTSAVLASLLLQLDASQWLGPKDIERAQFAQLLQLVDHLSKYSPHFRARLDSAGLKPADLGSPAGLGKLPVLRRRDIQAAKGNFFCTGVPKGHQPLGDAKTSGSTGEPVVVRRSAVTQMFWLALTMRDHFWMAATLDRNRR